MSGEVEKCPILHVRPKFDVFTLPSWICTNCVRGVLNGNGWDPFFAYRLILMVTSLTICNRFSFNILMNVNE